MAKASLNFKPLKENSKVHNERLYEEMPKYIISDFSKKNESWKAEKFGEIRSRLSHIEAECKSISGRKLYKNADPIREAVVNINSYHTMEDLKKLAKVLEEEKGIKCFQIHIHRDEGKSKDELNYHAHMLFDWLERDESKMVNQVRKQKDGSKKTIQVPGAGKTKKLNKVDMSQIQTLVAEALKMDRGELKVNSNRERLEPIEYKRQQEEIRIQTLQLEANQLEQKKNRAFEENEGARAADQEIRREYRSCEIARQEAKRRPAKLALQGIQDGYEFQEEEVIKAIAIQSNAIERNKRRETESLGALKEVEQNLKRDFFEFAIVQEQIKSLEARGIVATKATKG